MTSHQSLAEWSQWFWPVFANHLWQATLFALVAWVAAIWLNRARTRRVVWLIDRKLIEERELICDEQVVSSGAAPEAYAASLWKVVQFGFGWPVEGVSRAAGSNLKRRIKFMLNANHQLKSSTASRALAGITFVVLIALVTAMTLFSRDGAAVARTQNDQKFVATAPMRFENPPEIPIVIADARLSVGEARMMTSGGVDPDRKAPHLAFRGGMARDVEFAVNVVNQGGRGVSEFMIEIQNASFWANEHLNTISKPTSKSDAQGGQGVIGPQESFAFKASFPLQEKEGDKDLMSHLYDFKVRVTGVRFESDGYWLMARPGETPSTARVRMSFNFPANAAVREMRMRKKDSASEQDQRAIDSIRQMDSSTRPTILYRERAEYTQEARDEEVEGTVILSVVFGADSQISGVKIIRSLPAGLTEKAIEAAKKIRFEPAMKDGQPVSVRGTLEFTFKLW